MSKAEIIAELARLSPQDLAEVKAQIDELTSGTKASGAEAQRPRGVARLRSPRLVDPVQSRDFVKRVTELTGHAEV